MKEKNVNENRPPGAREAIGSAMLEKVDAARRAVSRAGAALNATLGEIQKAPRADKVAASDAVRTAFDELRHAMQALNDLEAVATDGLLVRARGFPLRDDERDE